MPKQAKPKVVPTYTAADIAYKFDRSRVSVSAQIKNKTIPAEKVNGKWVVTEKTLNAIAKDGYEVYVLKNYRGTDEKYKKSIATRLKALKAKAKK